LGHYGFGGISPMSNRSVAKRNRRRIRLQRIRERVIIDPTLDWYVCQAMRTEGLAKRAASMGLGYYLPTTLQARSTRGRRIEYTIRPAGLYAFVGLPKGDSFVRVLSLRGIDRILFVDDVPARVRARDLQRFADQLVGFSPDRPSHVVEELRAGDTVVLRGGYLDKAMAKVERPLPSRLYLRVENSSVRISVPILGVDRQMAM
jgi:hypothetical protein